MLPDFENPPLVEVALSVQFEPIEQMRTPQIGLLWTEFRHRFPVTQEHPPVDPELTSDLTRLVDCIAQLTAHC